MERGLRDDEYQTFSVVNDKKIIGPAEVNQIIYCFTPETGLIRVDIFYAGNKNIKIMHEVLEESWEKCPNIIIENKEGQVAQWYNDEIIATVYRYNYDIERLSILLKKINKKIY